MWFVLFSIWFFFSWKFKENKYSKFGTNLDTLSSVEYDMKSTNQKQKASLLLSLYVMKVGKSLNKSYNSTKCNSCGFGYICNMVFFLLCIFLTFGFLVHVDIWQTTYLPDVENLGHFTHHLPGPYISIYSGEIERE